MCDVSFLCALLASTITSPLAPAGLIYLLQGSAHPCMFTDLYQQSMNISFLCVLLAPKIAAPSIDDTA